MRTRLRTTAMAALVTLGLAVSGQPTHFAAAAPTHPAAPAAHVRPWLDRQHDPATRAQQLLAAMTLEEKVDLMTGDSGPYAFYNAPIDRLAIPALKMADAGSGVASRGWTLPDTGGSATAMPAEIALGATWSRSEARRYASTIADEVRETGQNVLLGPDADIARQPWFGRIAESTGEDPVLNAELASSYVRALQSKNVLATLKHFTAYNQETDRNIGQNSVVDERALHEVYALAFETAIARADLGAVMCSYNKINGEYACQNAHTLRTVLKGQLGFTGFVMSDFGALHDTLPGVRGGDDMETGTSTVYDGALLAAVQSGQVKVSLIDAAVLRILTTMFRVGIFDTDYSPTAIPVDAHNEVARQIEDKAITLLQNKRGVLPLTGASARSIALIGADADTIAAESGSSYVTPTTTTTTLQGLRARAGAGAVSWTPGNDPVNAASMIETSDATAVPSSVLSPETGTGQGLTARYWSNPAFDGPAKATRLEPQVNYDVGFASTFPGWAGAGTSVPLPPTDFFLEQGSVTYDGYLTAPSTGVYRLSLTGWGDATMTLDGQPAITMTGQDGRRVVDSAALALTAGVKHRVRIEYRASRPLTDLQPGTLLLQWKPPADAVSPAIAQAVAAARKARVAVVYVRTFESEERDRVSLKLPESANSLISHVAAANPRTVVVLASGGPVVMPWIKNVAGVVQTYFGGQAQGSALADVLFGEVNPSGQLPLSYPQHESDVPVANPWSGFGRLNVRYTEGVAVGYKGYRVEGTKTLFPFGYGLSYTTFRYRGVDHAVTVEAGRVSFRFRVTNTGGRAGSTVAQVYADLPKRADEPRRLATFSRVWLAAGQSKIITMTIETNTAPHALSVWDTTKQRWVLPKGSYRLEAGPSSARTPVCAHVAIR